MPKRAAKPKTSKWMGAWFDMAEVAVADQQVSPRRERCVSLRRCWFAWSVALAVLAVGEWAAADDPTPPDSEGEAAEPWIVEVNRSMPLAYQDERGNWRGFEIDRLNDIAQWAGRSVEYRRLSDPKNRFQALLDGTADIVLGGNSITAEREALAIDFSYPTFDSGLAIAVPWDPGKESGSRLMAVAYAYAHWELLPLILAAFVCACIFFRQLKRPEANSVVRGSLSMIAIITIVIMVHADVTTRLHDRDEMIARINGPDDLAGMAVATKRDTTSAELLPKLGVRLVLEDTVESALERMRDQDDVEAVVFDSPVLWYHAVQGSYGQMRIVGDQFARQKYGLAVREGQAELLEQLDRGLLRQDESQLASRLREIYFGNYR